MAHLVGNLLLEAILIGLAGWRVANLLVNEDGPLDIFERVRLFVGMKPGEISGFMPKLFSCIFCMSVWTTFGAYLTYLISPITVMIVAAMTIALVVDRLVNSNNG